MTITIEYMISDLIVSDESVENVQSPGDIPIVNCTLIF